ncbi:hypothetical protein SprV_0902785900 [Sparganum proliferum]
MMALVTDKGAISEAFAVTSGMKQDCELAPTLCCLMFSAIMMKACREERPKSALTTRPTGTFTTAGDCMPQSLSPQLLSTIYSSLTTSHSTTRRSMDLFVAGCTHFGRTINAYKTVVMHRHPSNGEYSVPRIRVSNNELKTVDNSNDVSLHQDRRQSGQADLESHPSLRQASELRMETLRPPVEYQADVQGCCPDDTSLRSSDLDRLLQPYQEAQLLPSGLSSRNTSAEMARQDPRYEIPLTISAMLRQLQLRRSEFSQATEYKSRDLEGRRPEQTGLGKRSEANRIAAAAAKAKRKARKSRVLRLLAAKHPSLPTSIPRKNRSRWAPLDPIRHQPDNVYVLCHPLLCQNPASTATPVTAHHTVAGLPPPPPSTDTIRSSPEPCIDRTDQHHFCDITHPPP